MDWKKSLDRYLTSEPVDTFTPYCEKVLDAVSDDFYNKHYDNSGFENSDTENRWLNKLFDKGYSPEEAAKIFERAYMCYIDRFGDYVLCIA
jgi:hypothetical protein